MSSIPNVDFERQLAEFEKSERDLRQDHAVVRALLDKLPRCSCGEVARYELPDGSYVCRLCCCDIDEAAAERVFEWERPGAHLDSRAAAWEAADRGDEAAFEDVHTQCRRAAASHVAAQLAKTEWNVGQGRVNIYHAWMCHMDLCPDVDSVLSVLMTLYFRMYECFAEARYGRRIRPLPEEVAPEVQKLVGGEDALARMRKAWGKDRKEENQWLTRR